MALHCGNAPRQRRAPHAQLDAGAAETAGACHFNEQGHIVQSREIFLECIIPLMEKYYPFSYISFIFEED